MAAAGLALLLAGSSGCGRAAGSSANAAARRVLVLGMDGLDPRILKGLMEAGKLPSFARVAALGGFSPLATSMPPQSPVAWSNFISGGEPDTHQIWDFIHRDPNPAGSSLAILPYQSISDMQVSDPVWPLPGAIPLGRWELPLRSVKPRLLRRGPAFWDHLVEAGVPSAVFRMPANYPPVAPPGQRASVAGGYETLFSCLCGMGTPDLLGSQGEFTRFTPDAPPGGRAVAGGRFARLELRGDRGLSFLQGPDNPLHKPDERGQRPPLRVEFEAVRDPQAAVVKLTIQDHVVVLQQDEWSEWLPIRFETGLPGSAVLSAVGVGTHLPAMVRFYVIAVHPRLELYATPLNFDPLNAANPISSPPGFAAELARTTGRFYTTGIPEDTKALRSGALDEDQFLSQVRRLVDERMRQFRAALRRFDEGFLFFYFGHTDQLAHVFWRDRDPLHPGRDPDQGDRYAHVVEDAYVEMDAVVAEALDALRGEDVLIVCSDHGFSGFRRGLHLNRWLVDQGYMKLRDPRAGLVSYLGNVDWSGTRAYALGINSLYLNLAGRERFGVVEPQREAPRLLAELAAKLLDIRDVDGARAVERVYDVRAEFPKADPRVAPDLLVGYAENYRSSWGTAEGGGGDELFEDNLDRWSGDHCIAAHLVPGVLLSNRPIVVGDPRLSDVAPTVLRLFGLPVPPEMSGRPLLAEN